MIGKLVGFLFVPILMIAVGGLGWWALQLRDDNTRMRAELAGVRSAQLAVTASETGARAALEKACTREINVGVTAGRAIERITGAGSPKPGAARGLVTADDLRSVVGE